jgi:metacaspase-1
VFSDSCHSGTVTKAAYYKVQMDIRTTNENAAERRYRFMPSEIAFRAYRLNKEFYDKLLKREDFKHVEDKAKASIYF